MRKLYSHFHFKRSLVCGVEHGFEEARGTMRAQREDILVRNLGLVACIRIPPKTMAYKNLGADSPLM